MLVIRQAQTDMFAFVAFERFTAEMLSHVRRFYTQETLKYDDVTLTAMIRSAIHEARGYGIVLRPEVCRYLNMTFEFGHGFDRLPWALAILGDPWRSKISRLCAAGSLFISPADVQHG